MTYLKNNILIFFVIATLAGCSTGSNLKKSATTADESFAAKNYKAALEAYQPVIADYENNGKSSECPVYTRAGISAFELGKTKMAIDYLQKATYTSFANENTWYYLGLAYQKIDNLSKELMTLEDYLEKFPAGTHRAEVRQRLFKVYMESENWEKAMALWPEIGENVRLRPDMQKDWFKLKCDVNESDNCETLAKNLLDTDPNYIPALEFLGEKYFWNAENRYRDEMKAYENNKTRKQYAHLLKALDEITADFKVALGYFQKLYKLDPKPRYAQFLSNIYLRFDNKEKSDYYRRKAEQ